MIASAILETVYNSVTDATEGAPSEEEEEEKKEEEP